MHKYVRSALLHLITDLLEKIPNANNGAQQKTHNIDSVKLIIHQL